MQRLPKWVDGLAALGISPPPDANHLTSTKLGIIDLAAKCPPNSAERDARLAYLDYPIAKGGRGDGTIAEL